MSQRRKRADLPLRCTAALCCALLLLPGADAWAEPSEPVMRAAALPLAQDNSEIRYSRPGGVYSQSRLYVRVQAPAGYHIAYTTDGSTPTAADDRGSENVLVYLKKGETGYLLAHREQLFCPLDRALPREDEDLPRGTVLRVALLDEDGRIAARDTQIYFLGEDFAQRYPGCLVLSVWTNPENLLDEERGLLNPGPIYKNWAKTREGKKAIRKEMWWLYESNSTQHGRDWERPCRLSIFDGGSEPAAELAAGLRVNGRASRRLSQKAFAFYFRKEYGEKLLRWPLFEGTARYRSFTLQAGGENAEGWKIKDGILQSLADGRAVTVAHTRPAVLFLNAEYWGPYLLREKASAMFLQERCGIRSDQAVMVKNGSLEVGEEEDLAAYRFLESFVYKDLGKEENYRAFCDCVDVRSFAEACAFRIYIGDEDWFWGVNEILWRARTGTPEQRKWHWMLHDLDCSAGIYSDADTAASTDHFLRAMENYPLFASALRSKEFRQLFFDCLEETASELCAPERVARTVAEWEAAWEPLMLDCYRRYDLIPFHWERDRDKTLTFFRMRGSALMPAVIRDLRDLERQPEPTDRGMLTK